MAKIYETASYVKRKWNKVYEETVYKSNFWKPKQNQIQKRLKNKKKSFRTEKKKKISHRNSSIFWILKLVYKSTLIY